MTVPLQEKKMHMTVPEGMQDDVLHLQVIQEVLA